ncbi:MAG TPA: hypothetical protein VMU15_03400 [Anaeromyxobacter sp.]|nr:hypothetical protein [Anaeromyxobacter sp.]
MRQTHLLAALALLASTAARADTVEARSTTFLTVGQDTRYRGGSKPDLVTVAPAYEILSVTARDLTTPVADFQVVLSTWGAVDLARRRWDAGTTGSSATSADVTTGYIQAQLAQRHLTLRAGRISVSTGSARMIQVDGGELAAALPLGWVDLKLEAYAGQPTAQRFESRSGEKSWNPTGGDLAYGGRAALDLPLPGLPGRALELGASGNVVKDRSDLVRQEVGGDVRFQPFARSDLVLTGFATYDTFDHRYSEAQTVLSASLTSHLHLTADWRFVEPDLLLSRTSILSVFSASTWDEYGGGLRYDLGRGIHLGADAHLRVEPGDATSGGHTGSDLSGRVDWESSRGSAGGELSYLNASENGYVGARIYGRRNLGKYFVAADVLGQFFDKSVNGQGQAVTGTLSAGLDLTRGFSALVSGSAGMTPYLEQTFDVMVKLAYNQIYLTREVR